MHTATRLRPRARDRTPAGAPTPGAWPTPPSGPSSPSVLTLARAPWVRAVRATLSERKKARRLSTRRTRPRARPSRPGEFAVPRTGSPRTHTRGARACTRARAGRTRLRVSHRCSGRGGEAARRSASKRGRGVVWCAVGVVRRKEAPPRARRRCEPDRARAPMGCPPATASGAGTRARFSLPFPHSRFRPSPSPPLPLVFPFISFQFSFIFVHFLFPFISFSAPFRICAGADAGAIIGASCAPARGGGREGSAPGGRTVGAPQGPQKASKPAVEGGRERSPAAAGVLYSIYDSIRDVRYTIHGTYTISSRACRRRRCVQGGPSGNARRQ